MKVNLEQIIDDRNNEIDASNFRRAIRIADLKPACDKEFMIAGRVVNIRIEDKKRFFEVYDGGNMVSVEVPQNSSVCRGDIIEISSKHYDGFVRNPKIITITRASVNLPEIDEWSELSEEEKKKYRDIEMIINPSLKKTFCDRSRINSFIRNFYEKRGFIEVETPLLVPFPEIAPVRPFVTKEPKYSQRADLRITNTEYIRRLMVAGFEKVYQLGKCFRDEPASFKHLPEFTQLTFGIAYEDYNSLMENIEQLTYNLAMRINDRPVINFRGQTVDLTPPWKRVSIRKALIDNVGIDIEQFNNPKELREEIVRRGFAVPERYDYSGFLKMASLVDKLVEDNVFDKLIQPTFLCEYPWYLGGPAKELDNNPKYKKRSEVFVAGIELANISTPQNDSTKIRKWYEETLKLKQQSGWRNQVLDEPYLHAIDQGIPICTTGGLGVDRLIMFILEKERIEEVVLFPWVVYKEGGYKND